MKKVAVINDLSGFGKCSLTAAIPVLSVQGVQVCPLPTAVLTNQTGYEEYFCKDLTPETPEYLDKWKKLSAEFDAILTGFVLNGKQVDFIKAFCREFKKESTLLIVDPIMADNGRLYDAYNTDLCQKVKDLAFSADIITPNLTEFALLTDTDYSFFEEVLYSERLIEIIKEKSSYLLFNSKIKTVIVTGVRAYEGKISNCIVDKDSVQVVSAEDCGGSFSGTGDLFAAIVCGAILKGESILNAVNKATRFIEIAVKATLTEGTRPEDGVCFEPFLKLL